MIPDPDYALARKAYEGHSNLHAMLLLHVIHSRRLEPLSASVVEQIAKAMIYCGDYDEPLILPETISFIRTLLDRTTLPCITSVDEAIRTSCTNPSSIPVICPATTTMSAVYYLNRYIKKFGRFTHSYYASQRLFLVAYFVASKFIHANVKCLVVTPPHSLADEEEASAATQLLRRMGNGLMDDHAINAAQLQSMEMEFLHFLDYQLWIGPTNPLQLWSWFYKTLDSYSTFYHARP